MFLINAFSRNLSCCGKGSARMHCIPCSLSGLVGLSGIWHPWQWLELYPREMPFRFTREQAHSKGFCLMGREASLRKSLVGCYLNMIPMLILFRLSKTLIYVIYCLTGREPLFFFVDLFVRYVIESIVQVLHNA